MYVAGESYSGPNLILYTMLRSSDVLPVKIQQKRFSKRQRINRVCTVWMVEIIQITFGIIIYSQSLKQYRICQCLRLKTCIFAVPSFFLDSEIKTTKLFIYTFFNYGLCLGLFFNRKEKTFSRQNHSHFYRTLNAASFSDERFNLNRVRNLWKRRITKSSINGRFLRRRSKLFGLLEFYPSVRML